MKSILNYTLNKNLELIDIAILFLLFIIWFFTWKLLLEKWLRKHDVNSFAYTIYEMGVVVTFMLFVMLYIFLVLFIASIQAVVGLGIKMLLPLAVFWGGFIAFLLFVIKHLKK